VNQYLGIDLLEIPGDGQVPRDDAFGRAFTLVGPGTGKRIPDDPVGVSSAVREYQWVGIGAADVQALKDFVDARKGRAHAFWLHTFEEDLRIASLALSGQSFIEIEAIGYAANLFPASAGRRHIAIINRVTGVTLIRKITAAENLLNGLESLTLDSPLTQTISGSAQWRTSFLRLCRLEDDAVVFAFDGRAYTTAQIRAREVPLEAPL
jgi:hypothetical protein